MENSGIEIPAQPNNPRVGVVVPQFEITEELLTRAREYVMSSKNSFEAQRTELRETWISNDRAYRCILEPDRNYQGFDDIASPIVHDNVEAIVARLTESVIPSSTDIVEIKSEGGDSGLIDYREAQLNFQAEKQNVESKIEAVARIATKFGTGFIKCGLINDKRNVLTRQLVLTQTPKVDSDGMPIVDLNGQIMMNSKEELQLKNEVDSQYFGPGYQVISDSEDVYIDRYIEDIQNQPIVIHRFYVDWEHLAQGVKNGIYFEREVLEIKDKPTKASLLMTRSEEILGTSSKGFNMTSQSQYGKPNLYEIYQAWCDFSIIQKTESGEDVETVYKCVISVINNSVVQLMPNPYFHQMHPFIKFVYRRIEGEAYGESAIDPVLGLYKQYNDIQNQLNDARLLTINPIVIARNTSTDQDISIEPGAIWYEREQGDIRPFEFNFGMIATGEQELEILEQRINRGMGITPLIQGAGDAQDLDKTWRGTTKLISQSDKKFKLIAKNIEGSAVKDWLEMAYKINCQFDPQLMAGTDNFEYINGEMKFVVKGVESFFEKQEKIQNISLFTQQFGQIPGVNIVALMMQYADLLGIDINGKFGPIYMQPQPPAPEEKPLNTSVTIPIDPTKGTWAKYAATQVLAQKGIMVNLDAVRAGQLYDLNDDEQLKKESGTLPAGSDSYPKGDIRNTDDIYFDGGNI